MNGMNLFLKSVLGLDYLWNTVRVQGGAYGGMSVITDKGVRRRTFLPRPKISLKRSNVMMDSRVLRKLQPFLKLSLKRT